jgi:hypothetical protein
LCPAAPPGPRSLSGPQPVACGVACQLSWIVLSGVVGVLIIPYMSSVPAARGGWHTRVANIRWWHLITVTVFFPVPVAICAPRLYCCTVRCGFAEKDDWHSDKKLLHAASSCAAPTNRIVCWPAMGPLSKDPWETQIRRRLTVLSIPACRTRRMRRAVLR